MPMTWNSEADAKLLALIMKVCDVKVPAAKLAEIAAAMGSDCTPKALTHRIAKFRTAGAACAAVPGSGGAATPSPGPKGTKSKSPKSLLSTPGSGKREKGKRATTSSEDDDEDGDGDGDGAGDGECAKGGQKKIKTEEMGEE